MAKTIVDFLKIVADRTELSEQCKAIGDKDSVDSEIQKLNVQLEQLSQTYDVTEEEIKQYQDSVESIESLKARLAAISKEITHIKEISTLVEVKTFTSHQFSIYSESLLKVADDVKNLLMKHGFLRGPRF